MNTVSRNLNEVESTLDKVDYELTIDEKELRQMIDECLEEFA